jgi:hypothetical protein
MSHPPITFFFFNVLAVLRCTWAFPRARQYPKDHLWPLPKSDSGDSKNVMTCEGQEGGLGVVELGDQVVLLI